MSYISGSSELPSLGPECQSPGTPDPTAELEQDYSSRGGRRLLGGDSPAPLGLPAVPAGAGMLTVGGEKKGPGGRRNTSGKVVPERLMNK